MYNNNAQMNSGRSAETNSENITNQGFTFRESILNFQDVVAEIEFKVAQYEIENILCK